MVSSYTDGAPRVGRSGSFKDSADIMFAALRETRTYWEALRDDQDLPRREQINPRGMAGALHQVLMLERVAQGGARFRLAGLHINDLMGMEVRGMPLSALFDPAARAQLAALVEKVTAARAIVQLDLEADRGIGRPALRGRMLLLPLKGSSGDADLILGCLATDGKIGRAPRRFVIARALETAVERGAVSPARLHLNLPNEATRTAIAPRSSMRLVTDLAKPAAPKFQRAQQKAAQPYLRLVRMEG